jgi:hypothetical protein
MTDKMITPKKTAAKKSSKPKNARIVFILDRSGSMSSIQSETIGGFNAFLKTQKEVPGKATVTLTQFDNQFQVDYKDIDIKKVPELNFETFRPRGYTALYDAIGKTVSELKEEKVAKNTKTILAILTDGAENASKEFTYGAVQNLLKDVQDNHDWEVFFIGANIDAKATAINLGIKVNNSVTFDYTAKGASDALNSVSYATMACRGVAAAYADGTAMDAKNMDMTKLYGDLKSNAIKSTPDVKA